MRNFPSYWWLVVTRAWSRAWAVTIQSSWKALLRDALLTGAAVYALHLLTGALERLHYLPQNDTSVPDIIVWAVIFAISVVALFGALFVIETLFITPYILWKEARVEGAASAASDAARIAADEDLILRKRAVVAQEMHTAAIQSQTDAQRRLNDPIIQSWYDAQRRAINAVNAEFFLVWRQNMLCLEIHNKGPSAEFDVRVDLSLLPVAARYHGPHPAKWFNDRSSGARKIPEGLSDFVLIYEYGQGPGYFFYAEPEYNGVAIPNADGANRVKVIVTSEPSLKGGPKSIEFSVNRLAVTVISGEAQVR